MTRRPPGSSDQPLQRARIASVAARLIAEAGISDYTQAKRKAARSLGLPMSAPLPDNAEVEDELRLYQRLYQQDEHALRLRILRQAACDIMALLESFCPYLAGSVLDGTAGRYAEIDIQLFAGSAKDVEIFLLNRHLEFSHSEPRTDRAEAVLTVHAADADINLVIYPRDAERVVSRTRDGRVRPRARREAVLALLAADDGVA